MSSRSAFNSSKRRTAHPPHTVPTERVLRRGWARLSPSHRGLLGCQEKNQRAFCIFLTEIPHSVPFSTSEDQGQTHSCSLRVSFHRALPSPSLLPRHAVHTGIPLLPQTPPSVPAGMPAGSLSVFPVQLSQPLPSLPLPFLSSPSQSPGSIPVRGQRGGGGGSGQSFGHTRVLPSLQPPVCGEQTSAYPLAVLQPQSKGLVGTSQGGKTGCPHENPEGKLSATQIAPKQRWLLFSLTPPQVCAASQTFSIACQAPGLAVGATV